MDDNEAEIRAVVRVKLCEGQSALADVLVEVAKAGGRHTISGLAEALLGQEQPGVRGRELKSKRINTIGSRLRTLKSLKTRVVAERDGTYLLSPARDNEVGDRVEFLFWHGKVPSESSGLVGGVELLVGRHGEAPRLVDWTTLVSLLGRQVDAAAREPATQPSDGSDRPPVRAHRRRSIEALRAQILEAERSIDEGVVVSKTYVLRKRLGEDGFGVVWMADERILGSEETYGRPVALKFIRPRHLLDEWRRARFSEGIKILSTLRHDHIVMLHRGESLHGEVPYFVMEYLEGGTLKQAVERNEIGLAELISVVEKIGDALEEMRRNGLVHRDVRPSNIMFDARRRPKLTDFDLAWKGPARPLSGTGTPGKLTPFHAPELRRDPSAQGCQIDVFGIAMVVVFALAGNAWNDELAERPAAFIISKLSTTAPGIKRVLLKATNAAPGARYATVLEFSDALKRAIDVGAHGADRRNPEPDDEGLLQLIQAGKGLLDVNGLMLNAALWGTSWDDEPIAFQDNPEHPDRVLVAEVSAPLPVDPARMKDELDDWIGDESIAPELRRIAGETSRQLESGQNPYPRLCAPPSVFEDRSGFRELQVSVAPSVFGISLCEERGIKLPCLRDRQPSNLNALAVRIAYLFEAGGQRRCAFQKRKASKNSTYKNAWDIGAAGYINPQEHRDPETGLLSPWIAARNEIAQELGVPFEALPFRDSYYFFGIGRIRFTGQLDLLGVCSGSTPPRDQTDAVDAVESCPFDPLSVAEFVAARRWWVPTAIVTAMLALRLYYEKHQIEAAFSSAGVGDNIHLMPSAREYS